MFKTLAARALVPVAITVTGFVVACCILLYSSMKHDQIEENILRANDISSVVVKSTRHAMLKADRENLRNIVRNIGEERIVEHVRIFNKQGVIAFSDVEGEVGELVDKDAEGCHVCHSGEQPIEALGPMEQARRFVNEEGEPVLAITAPIYNEPDCSNAACHYHPASRTVLGTLDIGLSEASLERTLSVMQGRLALFSVMVLVLTVGGVAALLRMNVIGPIHQLQDYVAGLAAGETRRPPQTEDELRAIADAAHEIKVRLDRCERDER